MRPIVGSVQRRGIFYLRGTIPDALRADMPAAPQHHSAQDRALGPRRRPANGARYLCALEEGRTSRRGHKKVERPFADLKPIPKLDRLRLRGANGARDGFHRAAAAQTLRKLAKQISLQQLSPA